METRADAKGGTGTALSSQVPIGRPALAAGAVVAALLLGVAALVLFQFNSGWMYDAKVYREGALAVLGGQDLYANLHRAGFTYTPFAALTFVPLAALPMPVIGVLWIAASALCLQLTIWLCLRWVGVMDPRRRLMLGAAIFAAAIWLDPVSSTLLLGQVNLVLMAVILVDVGLPDGHRWKGVGVGLAAAFKLLPAFFVLYFLVTGRMRAAVVAVATFAATVVVGFAALPRDSLTYWGGEILQTSRVGDPQNPRSQSLLSVLVRWLHTDHVLPLWVPLSLAVVGLVLVLAIWAERRHGQLLATCLCATATLLVSPITWQHHWVWVVPAVIWLSAQALRSRSWLLGLAAVAVLIDFYARPYQWIPIDTVRDLHLGTQQLILSSTYAAAALMFLVVTSAVILRERRRRTVLTSAEVARATTPQRLRS